MVFFPERNIGADNRKLLVLERFGQICYARDFQAILFEDLRKLGVIKIIEELTGEPLLPIRGSDGNYSAREPTEEEYERWRRWWEKKETLKSVTGTYFEIGVPYPKRNEDGSVSHDLKIDISHVKWVEKQCLRGFAVLLYTPKGELTIASKEITFSGELTEGNPRLEEVKTGLVLAMGL